MTAVVDRAGWGANPLYTPAGTIAVPTAECWLHHTASTGLHGASGMRSLQSGAINGGYVDLEYTYCVDTDGTVFISRGPAHNTAATGGSTNGVANNARSHAICAMGNFDPATGGQHPSDAMLRGIADCVSSLHAGGYIDQPRIDGPHQAAPGNATACCGANLIARIGDINAMVGGGGASPIGPPSQSKGGGAVDICAVVKGDGYYIVDSTGAVFAYGAAKYFGGANTIDLNAPIVGMAVRPQGDGYWLVASDGGVFAYGKAPAKGSMGGQKLNQPIVGITADDSGNGYALLAKDGGVFAFGAMPFKGAPTGHVN
jgi:hypothetical protein